MLRSRGVHPLGAIEKRRPERKGNRADQGQVDEPRRVLSANGEPLFVLHLSATMLGVVVVSLGGLARTLLGCWAMASRELQTAPWVGMITATAGWDRWAGHLRPN